MKTPVLHSILFLISLFSVLCACSQIPPQDVQLRVVIIRHGEKPVSGDNLSCKGLNRALRLPDVLDTVTGTPDFTYVPTISTGKSTGSVRMFQTVTPFAVRKNLTINSKHAETDAAGVADAIINKALDTSKALTVLLVWEHKNIPSLAKKLGVQAPPAWGKDDFDSIWILDYKQKDIKTRTPSFKIELEKIPVSQNCPD